MYTHSAKSEAKTIPRTERHFHVEKKKKISVSVKSHSAMMKGLLITGRKSEQSFMSTAFNIPLRISGISKDICGFMNNVL